MHQPTPAPQALTASTGVPAASANWYSGSSSLVGLQNGGLHDAFPSLGSEREASHEAMAFFC